MAILMLLGLKLMFRVDSGNRRSEPLDLGIGPLHMPGNQFCYNTIHVDNVLREKIKQIDRAY